MRTTKTTVLAVAAALLGAAVATPAASAAAAATSARSCAAAPTSSRVGRITGILAPRPAHGAGRCDAPTPPFQPYSGEPPLTNHDGPVMGTSQAVTVTPIYWAPSGTSFPALYRSLTDQFVTDAASASGSTSNVFATDTQYTDSSGDPIHYDLVAGAAIDDTDAYPTTGNCTPDAGEVYSDGTGYASCLTDSQLEAELAAVLAAHHLTSDLSHLYLLYLPKGVESCFTAEDNTEGGQCTISAQGGAFCGYHSAFDSASGTTVYADLPYAIEDSPVGGYTCSSDAGELSNNTGVGNQTPNGDLDADTVISVTSHEMNESITDPEGSAWLDGDGNEIGDDCAYIYGDSSSFQGSSGSEYNETINGHHYFIQEEFSDLEFAANSEDSCVQSSLPQQVTFTSTPPSNPAVSSTYPVTAVAGSSLPVDLSIDASSTSVCSLSLGTVTFNTTGACTIDANQAGSSQYVPAAQVQQVIDVGSFDGAGAMGPSPTTEPAGSSGDTVTLTYTAGPTGPSDGALDVDVPTGRGWSTPTTATGGVGEVTSTCGSVAAVGSTIEVTGMTLSGGASCDVVYGATTSGGTGATAPPTPGADTFTTTESQSAGGTLTALASSPSVDVVTAADGSGGLETPTTTTVVGATGTTVSFTYTAALGGTDGGELEVQVPTGWSAPSTSLTAPGFVSSSCGTASALGQTIDVQEVDLRAGGTCAVVYGSTIGAGPGAVAGETLGAATFSTTEKSTPSGTLTALAASPSVTLTQASSTTALTSGLAAVPYGHEQAARLTIHVHGAGSDAVATGSVTVRAAGALVCTATIAAGAGACAVPRAALLPGRHALVATYAGSATVAGSASARLLVTVLKGPTRTALTLSRSAVVLGAEQAARLVVTVTAPFGPTATGRVEVRAGARVLCTARLAGGRASCSLAPRALPRGTYELVAAYEGVATLLASSSRAAVLRVS